LITEDFERLPEKEARKNLGVSGDKITLLVTGGGGGDEHAGAHFARVAVWKEARPDVHVIFAAGPLYRGPAIRGPGITWLQTPGLAKLLRGIDLAVSAVGFNTAHELMSAQVPTLFVPQEKVADDQSARAHRFAEAGAARVCTAQDLLPTLSALVDDAEARRSMREAAAALSIQNEARALAVEMLSLLLDRGEVLAADAMLSPALLASPRAIADLADVAHALEFEGPRALEEARAFLDSLPPFPLPRLIRLATLLRRRVASTAQDLAALVLKLTGHPLVTGQSGTLISLVQLLTAAKGIGIDEVQNALLGTLDDCLVHGVAIGDLVRRVAESPESERPISNAFLAPLRMEMGRPRA
jgi:hypothetical protein